MLRRSAFTLSARRTAQIVCVVSLLLLASQAFGQQSYVGRYDLYSGYEFLHSTFINLDENGYHLQTGINMKPWYAMGFDYSVTTGDMTLLPTVLPTALQQTLGAELGQLAAAGKLPAGYALKVPTHSRTQSFAMGPQLNFRHFSRVTFFVHPDLGAIQEVATPHPGDPIASLIVGGLTPTGKKTDWQYFWGFGYGADLNFSKHFSLRLQSDFVHDHLYDDILRSGRNTVRFCVGPAFHFGKNVVE